MAEARNPFLDAESWLKKAILQLPKVSNDIQKELDNNRLVKSFTQLRVEANDIKIPTDVSIMKSHEQERIHELFEKHHSPNFFEMIDFLENEYSFRRKRAKDSSYAQALEVLLSNIYKEYDNILEESQLRYHLQNELAKLNRYTSGSIPFTEIEQEFGPAPIIKDAPIKPRISGAAATLSPKIVEEKKNISPEEEFVKVVLERYLPIYNLKQKPRFITGSRPHDKDMRDLASMFDIHNLPQLKEWKNENKNDNRGIQDKIKTIEEMLQRILIKDFDVEPLAITPGKPGGTVLSETRNKAVAKINSKLGDKGEGQHFARLLMLIVHNIYEHPELKPSIEDIAHGKNGLYDLIQEVLKANQMYEYNNLLHVKPVAPSEERFTHRL